MKQFTVHLPILILLLCMIGCNQEIINPIDERIAINTHFSEQETNIKIEDTLQYKILYFKADKKLGPPEEIQPENYKIQKIDSVSWLSYADFQKYIIKLSYKELEQFHYKLLIVATPSHHPEIDFSYSKSTSDKNFANLQISRTYNSNNGKVYPLCKHNYIGIAEITQEQLQKGIVSVYFQRAVGELIFDIGRYKTSNETTELEEGYNSTLDRVYQIGVTITNYTQLYTNDTETFKISKESEECLYTLPLTKDYKIDLDKAVPTNGNYGDIVCGNETTIGLQIPPGTTRLYATYLLMTPTQANETSKLQVSLKFYYYDTIEAKEGNPCTANLTLNLPQQNKELKIKPNNYTRTKIKIKQNRIIDVKYDIGDVEIDPGYTIN